jgi:hypothetical protein
MRTWYQRWRDRRRASPRPWIVFELVVVFALLRVYDWVKSLEHEREPAALHNARDLLAVERFLHIDIEATWNRWLAPHELLTELLVWWYQYSHITGAMTVLICCYIWRPQMYRGARNALVLTNVVGMAVFVVLPVMPPRLLPHAGYLDLVAQEGFGTTHGGPIPAAQFAAMPSLHLAWASWVAIVAYRMLRPKPFRELVFIYPCITTVAVIATGNHYTIDVLTGVALTLVACWATGVLRRAPDPVPDAVAAPASVGAIEP